jgi:hypothetical protein
MACKLAETCCVTKNSEKQYIEVAYGGEKLRWALLIHAQQDAEP